MADCIFCNIVNGKVKSFKIWEDEEFLILLDAFPVNEGHCLVLPKKHYKNWESTPEEVRGRMFNLAVKLASVFKKSLDADSFNIATAPSFVEHVHMHVVPRYDYDLMGFLPDLDNKRELPAKRMKELQKKLQEAVSEWKS